MMKIITVVIIILIIVAAGYYAVSYISKVGVPAYSVSPSSLPAQNSSSSSPEPSFGGTAGNPTESFAIIQNFSFNPADSNIKKGTKVTWTNQDSTNHTVTSDIGSQFNSPLIGPGQSFSHTFDQTGTFTYHCSVHPSMRGQVVVSE